MTNRKATSVALILILICATCITPGMAGKPVDTDGVHLLQIKDSPTKLDPYYYHLDPAETIVIDGNQYYWVRIGNVQASTLSKNVLAGTACYLGFGAIAAGTTAAVGVGATSVAPETLGGSVLIYIGAATGIFDTAMGLTAWKHCPELEKWFVDTKYRVVASDGTILMAIKKTNNAGIQELKKDGLDITHISHLSKEGKQTSATTNTPIKMDCNIHGICKPI